MLNIIKKQSVGTWITLGALILTVVSAIVYGVGIGGSEEGYFYGDVVGVLVAMTILAIVLELAVIALAQLEIKGIIGTVLYAVGGALKILIPILLSIAFITFISERLEGISYILFCDENLKEVNQTEANMASVSGAITTIIFYLITIVVTCVAAFFNIKPAKKAEEAVAAA